MLPSNSTNPDFRDTLAKAKPGLAFVVIIFGALIAFEIFNFTTTDHALRDLLGDLTFAGIPWATILALAFCGIDFAGIARLFTPEQGADEPKEVWYLFGAWLLAATMNAILTWWGVSMAVVTHSTESAAVVDPSTLTSVVPVFVAVMVWVIRILIIGTLSLALDRLLHHGSQPQRQAVQNSYASQSSRTSRTQNTNIPGPTMNNIPSSLGSSASSRPAVSRAASAANNYQARQARFSGAEEDSDTSFDAPSQNRGEPTYHSLSGRRGSHNGSGNGTADTNPFRRS